jgi:exodeoxyribonuclease V beta subunit
VEPVEATTAPLTGTHLVEASAGTGKTYTIATLYLRMVAELGSPAASILVVTYTRAATAELRGRVRERIREATRALATGAPSGDATLDRLIDAWTATGRIGAAQARLSEALRSFDEAAIYTIHGFCQRILQDYAFESGARFATALVSDETLLRDEIVRDFWTRAAYGAPEVVLQDLCARKPGPDDLLALAARVAGDPELPVLPAARDCATIDGELETRLRRREAARAAAGAIWSRERETIVALLCAPADLHGGQYRPTTIRETWAPELDRLFAATVAPLGRLPTWIEKLTNGQLQKATKKQGRTPVHPFFDACDALHGAGAELAARLDERVLALLVDLVAYLRRERRRRREATNTQSFDDLLHGVRAALAGPGGADVAARIRERYPCALIDECQDTDSVQHDVFRRIYGGRGTLYQIGDPKQAIFGFRGADVFAYLDAKRAAGTAARTLLTNWRSDPRLLAAVNTLFGRAARPFVLPGIDFEPATPRPGAHDRLGGTAAGEPPFEVLFLRNAPQQREEAERLVVRTAAAAITRFLASGATIDAAPVAPRDVAVLCRTNLQAIAMQDALRALGVPSVLQGDKSVFDTREAEEVQRLLVAMAHPESRSAIRAALATVVLGIDGAGLVALQDDEQAWDCWVRRCEEWHAVWVAGGFSAAFRLVLADTDLQPHLLALADGERRLTNVLHLAELLHRAEAEAHLGPLQLVRWLARMRSDRAARGEYAGDAEQIRLESDADALTLATIHRSKGLEYPIVYCPFLWAEARLVADDNRYVRFHDPQDADRLKLDIGSPQLAEHKELATRETLAESLRLLYVALTRAKHRCTIVWGAFRGTERSPLGYLIAGPSAADVRSSAGDSTLLGALARLSAAAPGAMTIADVGPESAVPRRGPDREAPPLACRTLARRIATDWRTSSFTGLVAARGGASAPAERGIDHDADDEAPLDMVAPTSPRVPLHDFPAGARAGQLLHAILQRLDFAETTPERTAAEVEAALGRHGFAPHWRDPLVRALEGALGTPLAEDGLTLGRIPRRRRLSEMEFVFPVASPRAPGPVVPLDADRLADVFARHAAPAARPEYAARLAALPFPPLAGYLRGFIDLVFEHDGRWYVVDYKSNHLGSAPDDYRTERLVAVMTREHYFLQYHLYLVALHRVLEARLPDYAYERHVGGVFYLFLRGMTPDGARGCGVFHDRPPASLILALSRLLAGAPAEPGAVTVLPRDDA